MKISGLVQWVRINRRYVLACIGLFVLLAIHLSLQMSSIAGTARKAKYLWISKTTILSDPIYRKLANTEENLRENGKNMYFVCDYNIDPSFAMNLFYYAYPAITTRFFDSSTKQEMFAEIEIGDEIASCAELPEAENENYKEVNSYESTSEYKNTGIYIYEKTK